MKPLALAGLLAGLLLTASSASAATRYVDDDRVQCPQATSTTIQAAINAAAALDVIRVCAGRYPEQLTLPAGKDGLLVASLPALAARVVAPATGLQAHDVLDEFEPRRALALVRVLGDRQRFNGFTLAGPLPPRVAGDACLSVAAIDVKGPAALLDGDAISGLSDNACTSSFEGTTGIRVAAQDAAIDRGAITGAAIGVALPGSIRALVQHTAIVGRGTAAGVGVLAGIQSNGANVSVRSNDISRTAVGIDASFSSGLVKGNELHDNGIGIQIGDGGGAEINANVVRRSIGDGILGASIGSHSLGTGALIRLNDVRSSGHDGIAIYGCGSRCFPATSTYRVDQNLSLGNARYDCFDLEVTNDLWTANRGVTDSPATLCSP